MDILLLFYWSFPLAYCSYLSVGISEQSNRILEQLHLLCSIIIYVVAFYIATIHILYCTYTEKISKSHYIKVSDLQLTIIYTIKPIQRKYTFSTFFMHNNIIILYYDMKINFTCSNLTYIVLKIVNYCKLYITT